ncbi:uncharacterized protein LOC125195138 [Salvia hispanica]|uniref:uncharacterized protein LOC125195138 n=1 Tax=Salvia hispanica TaxID=49212 RepID=UPI00200915B3|nr:uncharacterized protein LOC125195138 [Salvia hispanica]
METETEAEEIDSPEVKRVREDLLDEIDEDSDLRTSFHELDSFMKSFEEEITEGIIELASDSGESRPDLGYLLEASNDELGIPPPAASPARKELVTVELQRR